MTSLEIATLPLSLAGNVTRNNLMTHSSHAAFLRTVNLRLWQVTLPILMALGCFGNVMTMVVMRGLRTSQSTACLSVYFSALAGSDLLLLLSLFLAEWPAVMFDVPTKNYNDITCALVYFVNFVTSMTSAWFLMAMTCQRMMSVISPHRVGVLCTVKRAKVVTASLSIFACLICLQILIDFRMVDVDSKTKICRNQDENLAHIFYYVVLIIASIIPFVFLVIANVVLIRGVLQSLKMSHDMAATSHTTHTEKRAAKVSSMTTTLILTSASFLVLTIPICIAEIYLEEVGFYRGLIQEEVTNAQMTLAESAVLLLWMTNSAVNFYLYVLSGRKFRQVAKQYLCLSFQAQQALAKAS